MNGIPGFILKVLLISLVLSIAIKYGGPQLSIPATNATALVAILLPSVLLGAALGWRLSQSGSSTLQPLPSQNKAEG